jgi:uncharacterized protein (TIGR04222 family)
MDWLFNNPLGNMWGPDFLLFYAFFSVCVIVCAYLYVARRDAADVLNLPETPAQFDPYEIAYLRGEVNEVIRTAVYALNQKGLIAIESKTFRAARIRPSGATTFDLGDIERRVMDAIRKEPAIPQLFANADLREALTILCEGYRSRLNRQGLLQSEAARGETKTAMWAGVGILIALALYKLAAALAHGRSNVGLLCVFAFIACIALFATIGRRMNKSMSKRGKAYLERLQLAYGGPRVKTLAAATSATDLAPRAAALAMVGLFGLDILKGTPDAALAQTFAQSSGSDGGGGGGCGGGGGGGGGCGGCSGG